MVNMSSIVLSGAQPWNTLYEKRHKTEYLYEIGGVQYGASDLRSLPVLERKMFREPAIGGAGMATLDLCLVPKGEIPRAAPVNVHCRLVSGKQYTSWYSLGKFFISTRHKQGNCLRLKCRDAMVKAGTPYLEKTAFTSWPVQCSRVVQEICQVLGVSLDTRTTLDDGVKVEYPNELLLQEVLAMIAAAHGGNWIMTNEGRLRLLPFPDNRKESPSQEVGREYSCFTAYSTGTQMVSGVVLRDSAGNEFTGGNDTGVDLGAVCDYATPEITAALYNKLNGARFRPYRIEGAYLSPLTEIGDSIRITLRDGETIPLVIGAMKVKLGSYFCPSIELGVQEDDEEEIPYQSPDQLRTQRTVMTTQSYYGNRITREEGFVCEKMNGSDVVARAVLNTGQLSMQRKNAEDRWEDCIYFDTEQNKYVLNGSVFIQAVSDVEQDLSKKADKDILIAQLNVSPEEILINADRIKIGEFTYGDAGSGVTKAYYTGGKLGASQTATGFSASNANYAFWAGNGKFRVTQAGKVYASDGEFTGKLTSDSGKIAGFTFDGNRMYAGRYINDRNWEDYASPAKLSEGDTSLGDVRIATNGITADYFDGGSTMYLAKLYKGQLELSRNGGYFNGAIRDGGAWGAMKIQSCASPALTYHTQRVDSIKFHAGGNVECLQNLYCSGTKNRLMQTEHFGKRLLYAYETPTPYFGDIGEGIIGEDGQCAVFLDPVFLETVDPMGYQVFLQAYGEAQCSLLERSLEFFVVRGVPGTRFGWEVKARQRDHLGRRLDQRYEEDLDVGLYDMTGCAQQAMDQEKTDYGALGAQYYDTLTEERINP